jgi:hypothetical protein
MLRVQSGTGAAMGTSRDALKLAGDLIARAQRRVIDQRCEERHSGRVERAVISWRGQEYLVPVINISTRGAMIEIDVVPRIGEAVVIRFENCTAIHAFVRWVREGRLGINFGHEIVLA